MIYFKYPKDKIAKVKDFFNANKLKILKNMKIQPEGGIRGLLLLPSDLDPSQSELNDFTSSNDLSLHMFCLNNRCKLVLFYLIQNL